MTRLTTHQARRNKIDAAVRLAFARLYGNGTRAREEMQLCIHCGGCTFDESNLVREVFNAS